jgi:hypothetical protein
LEAWKQAGGLLEPLKKKMLFLDKTFTDPHENLAFDEALLLQADSADPTTGNGTFVVKVWYNLQ